MNTECTQKTAPSPEEVIALLRAICGPLSTERVPLHKALGRVLRESVYASEDQPAFDRASMDGFAVRLDDPGPTFRCVDEIRAGDWKPRQLLLGECFRIATGGAVPCDGLQVVMKEAAQAEGTAVHLMRRDASQNIRFRGEDCRAGQQLVQAGTRLQPGSLALLASLGHIRPVVTRLPRVLHVAIGDELVIPGQLPQPGQVRDSNSTLVRAFLQQRGAQLTHLRVREHEAGARSELHHHAAGSKQRDLLLISGGASVGEHDFTRRLIEDLGYTIRVAGTNARPGKPLLVGQRDNTLAFGLPGNPLAHFASLHLYVAVVLKTWSGAEVEPIFRRAILEAHLTPPGDGRVTFWPACVRRHEGAVWAQPLGWSSSGDSTALATANALIRIAPGCESLAPGTQVEFVSTTHDL